MVGIEPTTFGILAQNMKNMPGHGGNQTCDLWNTSS
jgi:hypothetical protein